MTTTFFSPADILQTVITAGSWEGLQDFVVLTSYGDDRYLLQQYDDGSFGRVYRGTVTDRGEMHFPGVAFSQVHYKRSKYTAKSPAENAVEVLAEQAERSGRIIEDVQS